MVSPHLFKGGSVSDYETFIGSAGTYNTRHIPSGKSVPCVQPTYNSMANSVQSSGVDMLSIANLAVGVLNLGVGVYNAFKLHKIENKLDRNHNRLGSIEDKLDRNHQQIQSYFGSIEKALKGQQRTLEILATSTN